MAFSGPSIPPRSEARPSTFWKAGSTGADTPTGRVRPPVGRSGPGSSALPAVLGVTPGGHPVLQPWLSMPCLSMYPWGRRGGPPADLDSLPCPSSWWAHGWWTRFGRTRGTPCSTVATVCAPRTL